MCPWRSSWRRTRRSCRCPGSPEEARLDAREDAKWQRRRELMAKVKEQASSEEDENPAAPPGGSVFTKALKVSEGLYQCSDDQMVGDFLPDLTGIPMPKAGALVLTGPPTIPPASGSGVTSSGAEGPDKPSATPVGLDTKDPEVQLSVLRWMMSKRVGEVRIFAGRWVRRPGPVHVPDWAKNLTKVNPEALEKGTHPRNHQVGGLPWARYSVDELNQQAKAGDRPYPEDLRSIFWAAPHDPDEDFHWTRQIPGLLGMFGHSYTLRQLWGVWESLPLLQGPRQRGPRNKAQNQTRLAGWETLKEDARCFLKEEGLPFPQTGPEWRLVYRAMGKVLAARAFLTDTPAEVMQLPVQDVADSKEQMILRAVCDERISVPVQGLQHFPEVYKALMDRIGGPGALAEVKVNWRCNTKQWWVGAVPDSVAPSIYRKLGYTNDMIKLMGLDPSAPGCRTGADGPDIRLTMRGSFTPPSRRTTSTAWWVRNIGRRSIRWR